MKLVQHPNVVRLYEVIDTQTKLYLILELGDGGDLYDYIMRHDSGLSEEVLSSWLLSLHYAVGLQLPRNMARNFDARSRCSRAHCCNFIIERGAPPLLRNALYVQREHIVLYSLCVREISLHMSKLMQLRN